MSRILFHYHTREEIAAFAEQGYAVVVPLGATEQHGPYLPVFTDSFVSEHVVSRAVQRASETVPILMAPPVTVGCSDHHLGFNGTISISSSTYLSLLRDIAESLVTCGFKKIIFINGHGGNEKIMHQITQDIAVENDVWTASASYWSITAEAFKEMNASEVGMVPGHAGGFETSLILALKPDLVQEGYNETTHPTTPWLTSGIPGAFIGKHKHLTGEDGYTDAATHATAEKGEQYLEAITSSLTKWLIDISNTMQKHEGE